MWQRRFLQYTPPAGLPEDGGSRFTEMPVLIFDYMRGHPGTLLLWTDLVIYKYITTYPLQVGHLPQDMNQTENQLAKCYWRTNLHTLVTALRNLTPRYDMASMMSGVPLASLVEDDFFSFWMDFLVDSVPLSSFTTVEPRYYRNQNKITHFLTSYTGTKISVTNINPLKPKRRPLYLKTQSVPRCKHFSSRL